MSHRKLALLCGCLGVLLCLSVSINVRQGRRILSLEDSFEDSPRLSEPGKLSSGTGVKPLRVSGINGESHVLRFDRTRSKGTVLYVFRPGCVWCRRNQKHLMEVARQSSKDFTFVGLSLSNEGVREFVEQGGITFPVYVGVSPEDARTYRLGTTPETIVISPAGQVVESWFGAYSHEPTRTAVERFFSIRFPKEQVFNQDLAKPEVLSAHLN